LHGRHLIEGPAAAATLAQALAPLYQYDAKAQTTLAQHVARLLPSPAWGKPPPGSPPQGTGELVASITHFLDTMPPEHYRRAATEAQQL